MVVFFVLAATFLAFEETELASLGSAATALDPDVTNDHSYRHDEYD